MPKKNNTIFICSKCGNEFSRWSGKCSMCGEWNSLKELKVESAAGGRNAGLNNNIEKAVPISLGSIKKLDSNRIKTGIEEFDLVLGDGMVPGSVLLLGGQPGVGKSTLVWQVACTMKGRVVYVAGEESPSQIKLRAERLGKNSSDIIIFENQDISSWLEQLEQIKPDLLIIDSIQTVFDSQAAGSPGSLLQVKHCALKIISMAKRLNIATIIIGHVTKEGQVAGPKTLEHLVDTVLYLEGDRFHAYRLLRTVKNRFGGTDEVGIFEMQSGGLQEVKNPSAIFLEERAEDIAGSATTCVVEGSRPLLVEIQSLVSRTYFGYPQRRSGGFDLNRLQVLIGVLSRRAGLPLDSYDVFLNVVGGVSAEEPAADLAVVLAIASAIKNKTLPKGLVAFGEVGLGGGALDDTQGADDRQRLLFPADLEVAQAALSLRAPVAVGGDFDGAEGVGFDARGGHAAGLRKNGRARSRPKAGAGQRSRLR